MMATSASAKLGIGLGEVGRYSTGADQDLGTEMLIAFFVNSPEGEQQFELAVGQNTTVAGISQPIEVSAVRL